MQMDWNSDYIAGLIARALAEDIGAGDVTVAATIPASATATARIIAKQDLVCAGLPIAESVFRRLDPHINVRLHATDGQDVKNGQELLHLSGKAAAILTGERTALNFLGHLSGVATLTHKFVEAIAGTHVRIRSEEHT